MVSLQYIRLLPPPTMFSSPLSLACQLEEFSKHLNEDLFGAGHDVVISKKIHKVSRRWRIRLLAALAESCVFQKMERLLVLPVDHQQVLFAYLRFTPFVPLTKAPLAGSLKKITERVKDEAFKITPRHFVIFFFKWQR